ncbi:hypothetical protein Hanom_Chr14g01280081 [Helianthus anomalus]
MVRALFCLTTTHGLTAINKTLLGLHSLQSQSSPTNNKTFFERRMLLLNYTKLILRP